MHKLQRGVEIIFLAAAVAVMSIGCGNSSVQENTKAEETKEVAGEQEESVVVFQLGYENNPGEPFDLAANRWAELLEEASGGTMRIDLFPAGQLGTQDELIDQIIAGENIITLADPGFYADRGVKDFGIMYGPYMFDDWDDVWKVTESDWYKSKCEELEEYGIKTIASNWIYGDRHTLSVDPIESVDDLKGKKIRVPNTEIQIAGFKTLGAVPTPMSLSEVYTSLQQGVIDGLENPLSTLYNGRFQEVAKYLILDGHVKDFSTLICNVDIYNGLTDEQKELLVETCMEAGKYNNEICSTMDEDYTEKFVDEGVTVITPDEETLNGFREKAAVFYEDPDVTKDWTEGLYETIQSILKE